MGTMPARIDDLGGGRAGTLPPHRHVLRYEGIAPPTATMRRCGSVPAFSDRGLETRVPLETALSKWASLMARLRSRSL